MSRKNFKDPLELKSHIQNHDYSEVKIDFDKIWDKYAQTRKKEAWFYHFMPEIQHHFVRYAGMAAGFIAVIGLVSYITFSRISSPVQSAWITMAPKDTQINNGNSLQEIKAGVNLSTGSKITTGSGAVELQIIGKALVRLNKETKAVIEKIQISKSGYVFRIRLDSGEAVFRPLPLGKNDRFEVAVRAGTFSVTGTRFKVSTDASGNAELAVLEGSVLYQPDTSVLPGAVSNTVKSGEAESIHPSTEPKIQTAVLLNETADEIATLDDSRFIKNTADITNIEPLPGVPGKPLWEKTMPPGNPVKTYFYQEHLIEVSDSGLIITTADGELKADIHASLTRPVISGETILAGSDSGGLYAYNLDGKLLWKNDSAGQEQFYASPAAQDKAAYIPTIDKGIQVFNLETGELLDTVPGSRGEAFYSTPYITPDGLVIFANDKNEAQAYNPADKKIIWKTSIFEGRILLPVTGSGKTAAIISRNGEIAGMNLENGSVLWKKILPELAKSSIIPVVENNKLYTAGSSSAYEIDLLTGAILSKKVYSADITDMAVSGRDIVVSCEGGLISGLTEGNFNEIWNRMEKGDFSIAISERGVFAAGNGKLLLIGK